MPLYQVLLDLPLVDLLFEVVSLRTLPSRDNSTGLLLSLPHANPVRTNHSGGGPANPD